MLEYAQAIDNPILVLLNLLKADGHRRMPIDAYNSRMYPGHIQMRANHRQPSHSVEKERRNFSCARAKVEGR